MKLSWGNYRTPPRLEADQAQQCFSVPGPLPETPKALGGDYEVEKVSELSKIMAFGIFTTPALVVDGEVKVVGQVPSVEEIKKMIAKRREEPQRLGRKVDEDPVCYWI